MRLSLIVWMLVAGGCFLPRLATAFVQEDLDRLLKTNECQKCDLSGASLAGRDMSKAKLEGANLSGADMTRASLSMADLAGANLSGAKLSGTVFDAADLFQANLRDATIDGARFVGAYTAEAQFDPDGHKVSQAGALAQREPAALKPAQGEGENGAPLETGLEGKEPPPAKINEAPSSEKSAEKTVLKTNDEAKSEPIEPAVGLVQGENTSTPQPEAPLEIASAPESKSVLIKQAKKSGFCIKCDFSGAMLDGESLKGLNLERANFSGAQMAGANLKQTDLKGAIFRGANLSGAVFRGADLYLADFSGADLSGADFRGALLGGEVMVDAKLTGALFDDPQK